MTWSETCRHHQGELSDLTVFVLMTTLSHLVFYFGAVTYYRWVRKLPSMQKYKVPLPEGSRVNKDGSEQEAVRDALWGAFVVVPITSAVLGWVFELNVCGEMKEWWVIVGEHVFHMIFTDATFYWAHRALHTKWLYARIHKQHHEFKTLDPICAEYDHPLEDAINMASTAGGPLLLGSHPVTLSLHVGLRLLQSVDAHSGYSLPFPYSVWNLGPMWSSSKRHSYHHGVNVGNYGDWLPFWDWLCGTDKSWRGFYFAEGRKVE